MQELDLLTKEIYHKLQTYDAKQAQRLFRNNLKMEELNDVAGKAKSSSPSSNSVEQGKAKRALMSGERPRC